MRLQKYIIESYRPSKAEISKATAEMAKYWKLRPDEIEYKGVQDERKTVGKVFLWFGLGGKYKKTTKTYQVYPEMGIPEVLKKGK